MSKGYIKLHRKIKECYLWNDKEPFDKRSAWIDLLLEANHTEAKILINNNIVQVERGQFITSEIKLSEKWKWDRGKVRRFLSMLEKDQMINKLVTGRQYITIEIRNYNQYQESYMVINTTTTNATTEPIENTGVEVIGTTTNATTNEQRTNINNNDNNEKNINIPYFEIISYLNKKAGTAYKPTTSKTKDLIHARWNEKFTLEDFKTVIDIKCSEWNREPRNGEQDMRKYLRPETLFGTKFESYLNQGMKLRIYEDDREKYID